IYGTYLLLFVSPELKFDEPRYLGYARHLANGYFADPNDPQLVNGPGYPFLVWLMTAAGMPLTAMRAVSVLLMAFAVWFTYRAILPYAGPPWALGMASLLALHPMLLYVVPLLMSEGLTLFCVAGFGWAITALFRQEKVSLLLVVVCVGALAWL